MSTEVDLVVVVGVVEVEVAAVVVEVVATAS